MDQELLKRIDILEKKVELVYQSAEKIRRYFFWTMVMTLVFFVLPLLGLVFAVPMFLSSYLGGMEGLM